MLRQNLSAEPACRQAGILPFSSENVVWRRLHALRGAMMQDVLIRVNCLIAIFTACILAPGTALELTDDVVQARRTFNGVDNNMWIIALDIVYWFAIIKLSRTERVP
ncbi:hypothetical protein COS21_00230 [bacterium (Candidatus Gribaldobacteria) CG02_land_8_20_14_3_00_41_15]|uniref:Uncharacterized protein n=1 Tax=bacterium (Candidatus Gribaldobacteria) CG02_land_8_20_14_3_00_41_15 TaxID=2014270 RepID=A0A2M7DEV8_9BACT|nr:MAG: hypothetical protein COS21_00230 [bacterium (Candidatus Gribaldobacteria) CG02_land_8_20_14_3_00_41_15]